MRVIRVLATAAGSLLLVVGTVGVAAHFSGLVSTTATLIASFTPLLLLAVLAALVLLLIGGQRLLVVLAAVVLAVGVWTQWLLFHAASTSTTAAAAEPARMPSVRTMQANIFLGGADADALVAQIRAESVDVLTVVELTEPAVERLAAAGVGDGLPYSFIRPRGGGGGIGIYSRHPLSDGELLDGFALNNVRATLTVPGAQPHAIYALHPLPPYPEPSWRWASELDRLHGILGSETRPLIVGADFNSTFDHKRFRELLAGAGGSDAPALIDAAAHLGSGIVATYPANRRIPAVLAIDRILTRGATPTSFRRIDIVGSDHHGVIGDVRLATADRR
ncbi:MAG TPA: endonuclease/exonuclease/phosphatase family protein [Aldersonia sp.]